jgi:hypothetical protein
MATGGQSGASIRPNEAGPENSAELMLVTRDMVLHVLLRQIPLAKPWTKN